MVLYLFWLQILENLINLWNQHFSYSPLVKNLPANAGDMGLIPGPGDSTCCEATKSMCHNYWTHSLDPMSCSYWACVPPMVPVCACYEPGHTAGGEQKCHLLLALPEPSSPCHPQSFGTVPGAKKVGDHCSRACVPQLLKPACPGSHVLQQEKLQQ